MDAITCSIHGISLDSYIRQVLHQDPSVFNIENYGRYGYHSCARYADIKIYFNGRPKMGLCLDLRSTGCTDLVKLTQNESIFYDVFASRVPERTNLTRIDIAADDHCGLLDMGLMDAKVAKNEVRTRLQTRSHIKSLDCSGGHTIYIGSTKSNYLIRIYDKAAQTHTSSHWVRVELVMRHEAAKSFQDHVLETTLPTSNDRNAQIALLGVRVIKDKLDFIEVTDSNISRCPVSFWWDEFLNRVEPLHLAGMTKEPATLKKIRTWLEKQTSGSLALTTCLLGPEWLDKLVCDGTYRIKNEIALPLVQEIEASGLPIAVDPFADDLPDKLRETIAQYYHDLGKDV